MTVYPKYLCVFFLLSGRVMLAQLGAPAPPSAGSQAVQLPLSGRSGQSGSVAITQTPVPGRTTSVNTLSTSVQVQGPYQGSVTGQRAPLPDGKLSLRDAVARGIQYNLGAVGLSAQLRQVRGQQRVARSGLMPNVSGSLRETVQQTNLRAMGVRIPFGPSIVGPFNYFDLRASLTQTIADLTTLNNYRSAQASVRASEMAARDARDLVVLAVGGAYLQVVAAKARLASARAQIETAQAVYKQSADQRRVGLVAQVDVNRNQVELQTQQQRLASLENDLAKQKINLARLVGLPPVDTYDLSDDVPFAPSPSVTLEAALKQAFENRADLKSAEAQVRAAERSRSAARAERLPSLAFNADYGAIGINPSQSHGTFSVTGTLRIPIWQGGRVEGEIQEAEAAVDQRRAELEDLRGRIESDVRTAFLDLATATTQIDVARNSEVVAKNTLDLTRQRFEAGITTSVEVVQAQEALSNAQLDTISSIFSHNVAKLSLARAIGKAEENYAAFLNVR